MISSHQWEFYLEHGYLIVECWLTEGRLEALREELENRYVFEGDLAGSEGSSQPGVRRLCNLIGKGDSLAELATDPLALESAQVEIGSDVRWQAMNFHDPIPGDPRPHQAIHADRSFFPNCTGYLNVVWAIDEMTKENGATRLVPGSHKGPWPRDRETWSQIPRRIFLERYMPPVPRDPRSYCMETSGTVDGRTFLRRPDGRFTSGSAARIRGRSMKSQAPWVRTSGSAWEIIVD